VVTLFARPPDEITRAPVRVMLATCADELPAIQALWPWFEKRVGLRGRKMYGAADLVVGTYTTCTPIRPDDNPVSLGLEVGELRGGRFRRGRLVGEPPAVYSQIGPAFAELESAGGVDRSRPLVEFYKRRDVIELWLPTARPRP
jgi:hypothetical protein